MTNILTEALEYRARGWSIIPIKSGTKKPACRTWEPFQNAAATATTIKRWFPLDTAKGLAVICGPVSGNLVIRDFDKLESYERWADEFPEFAAKLPTVETSRGRHVYCRADLQKIIKYDDGELRGNGYCLLPPSRHPSGHQYRWLIPLGDELPFVDVAAAGLLIDYSVPGVDPPCVRANVTQSTQVTQEHTGTLRILVGVGECPETEELNTAIEKAIAATLPHQHGARHRAVFEFARHLKAIPALTAAHAANLMACVRKWHSLALPHIQTKPFEETWCDFLKAWPKVEFPAGESPLNQLYATAVAHPAKDVWYEQVGPRVLVTFVRELHRASNGGEFFLSCRSAATLFGITPMTVSRWLLLLEHDGIIRTVEKGSRTTRKASTFRCLKPHCGDVNRTNAAESQGDLQS